MGGGQTVRTENGMGADDKDRYRWGRQLGATDLGANRDGDRQMGEDRDEAGRDGSDRWRGIEMGQARTRLKSLLRTVPNLNDSTMNQL